MKGDAKLRSASARKAQTPEAFALNLPQIAASLSPFFLDLPRPNERTGQCCSVARRVTDRRVTTQVRVTTQIRVTAQVKG